MIRLIVGQCCLALLLTSTVGEPARAQDGAVRQVNVIPTEECNPFGNPKNYPFNLDRVRRADAFARRTSASQNDKVRVVVLDNGFVGYSSEAGARAGSKNFPAAFFYNRPPLPFSPFNRVTPAVTGTNQFIKGHGTHVAGIILGGMRGTAGPAGPNDYAFPEVRRLLLHDPNDLTWKEGPSNSWLELFIFGLSPDGASLNANGLEGFVVRPTPLPGDFRPPEIMNVSLLYTPANDDIPAAIRTFPANFEDTLIVASAGNLRAPLMEGGSGHYPAMALGQHNALPVNMLVVGSHDADFKRSEFSNYHATRVDISAPGCAIESWITPDEGSVTLSGTSQAAAIVTFAAALLRTHWGSVEPTMLRERLLVSAKYSQDLAKGCNGACVRFGSMLDIEMALYYTRDVIEYCVDENAVAPDCEADIVAGTLKSLPDELGTCIANAARQDPNDESGVGLSWPGAIRRTDFQHFEAIVRAKDPPFLLDRVCASPVPSGNFEIFLEGQPQVLRSFTSARVLRVVTRSPYQHE